LDWGGLFQPQAPPAETILRGTLVYWALFFLFRFVLRRNVGSIGIADILFVVLVADAVQNSMIGDTHTITDGLILVLTLVAWNRLLDWMNFQFPALRPFTEPAPLLLVRDGRILMDNLRKEQITEEELEAKIRASGVESIEETARVFMESDGVVSVIPKKRQDFRARPKHWSRTGGRSE
jgi:uncharacterized membrane protein YcaP (DUF421 family)